MLGEHTVLSWRRKPMASRFSRPPVLVRHPRARLAGVVEVEHRGHGVDPQAVDVELVDPVERVGDEEVADLVAAVVEDERAPVRVLALAGIGVLVERGAVEAGEGPVVLREVGGHPVDDDADAALVEVVDEVAEVVGRPEPRRRREVAGHLVAPRAAERMLHHRQQLDVGEAEVERRSRRARGPAPGTRGRAATSPGGPRRCEAAGWCWPAGGHAPPSTRRRPTRGGSG